MTRPGLYNILVKNVVTNYSSDAVGKVMKLQNYEIKKQLDAKGLTCPEPVMLLHKAMREVVKGDCIEVIATDPSTQRDIPKFCQFLNHELLWQEVVDQHFIYHLRKGG